MIELYGIPNCDTVKRARKWLEANGIAHAFHDYKKEGVDPAKLEAWIDAVGLKALVNTRGTTWRKLSDEEKALGAERHTAVALLVQHPSIIKRPVVEHPGGILTGFKEETWSATLS